MPHLLELFSGTGSVGKVFEARGWDVTSVDIDPEARATLYCDILDLTPADIEYDHGPPDFIWASVPCEHYSRARTTAPGPRNFAYYDGLVERVLDIVEHYGAPFMIENPQGLLQHRPCVAGIPKRRFDHCKYADERHCLGFQKRTHIFTNTDWYPARPLCRKDCTSVVEGTKRHRASAQRGPVKKSRWPGRFSLDQLHQIPPAFVEEIEAHMKRWYEVLRQQVLAEEADR